MVIEIFVEVCPMKKRFICLLMLCMALLVCIGAASAEETPVTVTGSLISEGEFPAVRTIYSRASTDELEEYLISRLSSGAAEINVLKYGMGIDEFINFYWDMLNSNPELFYVAGEMSYYNEGKLMKSIIPKYLFTGSELQQRIAEFEDYVDSIARYASVATTDVGRMLRANDYFCVNYEYDLNYDVYRPDLLFRKKTGVCQAYMLAYAAVLNELGIDNTYASSEKMNHIWNLVKLDGAWYHIDVTWNDPVDDMPLRARHYYFLLSDAGFEDAGHHDWKTSVTANSDKYDDFFWRNMDTPLPVTGNDIYYFSYGDRDGERSIYSWDEGSGETSTIHTFPVTSYYYPGFMGIAVDSHFLYYGEGDTLYGVSPEGGSPIVIHVLEDEDARIWSAWREGSKIKMLAGSTLNGKLVTADIPNLSSDIAVLPAVSQVETGGTTKLYLVPKDDPETTLDAAWSSSNVAIATVNKKGVVTGKGMGIVEITALSNNVFTKATVIVHSDERIDLPEGMTAVREEAFAGVAAEEIIIPGGVLSIGENAFRDCAGLKMISIPRTVASIADNAFAGCGEELLILAAEGSAAHSFAGAKGISCLLVE